MHKDLCALGDKEALSAAMFAAAHALDDAREALSACVRNESLGDVDSKAIARCLADASNAIADSLIALSDARWKEFAAASEEADVVWMFSG